METEVCVFGDHDNSLSFSFNDSSIPGCTGYYESNPLLNQHISQLIDAPHIVRITFVCTSLRNGAKNDARNAFRFKNGSAMQYMQAYSDKWKTVSDKIELSTALLDDFGSNNPPGTLWKILRNNQWDHLNHLDTLPHGRCNTDSQKVLLFFIHVWYRHQMRLPNTTLEIHLFDDQQNIHQHIHYFFSKNPDLLPPSVTIKFFHYEHCYNDKKEEIYKMEPLHDLELHSPPSKENIPHFDIYAAAQQLRSMVIFLKNQLPVFNEGLTLKQLISPPPIEKMIVEQTGTTNRFLCCFGRARGYKRVQPSPPTQTISLK